MPTYEYRCQGCGNLFDVDLSVGERDRISAQLVKDEKPTKGSKSLTCPKCDGADLEQHFSAFYAKTSKKS
jgi:predicted nucleic acid-binding Zn ribbon protein